MKFIKELNEGNSVNGVYLCKQRNSAVTKNGKEYENLVFADKTGIMDGKIWDVNSNGIEDCDKNSFVYVVGDVVVYNGNKQLNVKRLRVAEEGEYDKKDYYKTTNKDIEVLKSDLKGFMDSVENPYLKEILEKIVTESTIKAMSKHSAAKSVHHAFVGGLLEHTVAVTRICEQFTKMYDALNHDLLITAAILHDIGKLKELSPFPTNDYTDEGQLIGHIVIGAQIVANKSAEIEGFPTVLRDELMHCILAHHGELEFGSPKKPALIEAVALNMADNADAKIQSMTEIYEGDDEEGWFGYSNIFGSRIKRTSEI